MGGHTGAGDNDEACTGVPVGYYAAGGAGSKPLPMQCKPGEFGHSLSQGGRLSRSDFLMTRQGLTPPRLLPRVEGKWQSQSHIIVMFGLCCVERPTKPTRLLPCLLGPVLSPRGQGRVRFMRGINLLRRGTIDVVYQESMP